MMGIAQKVAREIAARVKGTVPYKVRLKMRGHRLLASCTCPYFAPTGVPCKHIWATVLATDARGLLPSAPVRPLELVPVMPGQKKAPPAPGEPHPRPPAPTYSPY